MSTNQCSLLQRWPSESADECGVAMIVVDGRDLVAPTFNVTMQDCVSSRTTSRRHLSSMTDSLSGFLESPSSFYKSAQGPTLFFTEQQDMCGRFKISPLVKVLIALKLIGYGFFPSAFQDYFQMSETIARLCLLKFCRIVSTDESDKCFCETVHYRMTNKENRYCGMVASRVWGLREMAQKYK